MIEQALPELPHSEPSEKFVLSSMMKDETTLEENTIDPDWFYHPGRRTIYREMVALKPFDLSLFTQRLYDKGVLDNVGGPQAIVDIYTYAVGPHFKAHFEVLRDRFTRRMAITALTNAIIAARDCSGQDGEGSYLDALTGPISAVFDSASAISPVKDIKRLGNDFVERFEKLIAGVELPMGIAFGIPEIDYCLKGMHPQHYGIISGRPGGGKSTLATEILANLANQDCGGLYLILERTESSAFVKAIIQTARVHHEVVKDPLGYAKSKGLSKPETGTIRSIRAAIQKIAGANLHIRKPENRRISSVTAEIRRYVRLHKVRIVFVDQIGLIRGERIRGDSGEAELRGVSNTLQELAHELHITIVVLCQESADGETKNARAIEEDADWWLSIVQERDKKKENFGEHLHILIAKDSHGGNAGQRLPITLDKETLRFVRGEMKDREEPRKTRWGS